jgi:SNF2 family DNA or RNA helicase
MFLLNKPKLDTNINHIDDEVNNVNEIYNMTYLGIYELPLTLNTELLLEENATYKYSIEDNNITIEKIKGAPIPKIFLKLNTANGVNSSYTLFTPSRMNYLSKDKKYIYQHITLIKSPYIANRYILHVSLFLNNNVINDLSQELTSNLNNIEGMQLKDIILFVLIYNKSIFELKINNIKNINYGIYTLKNEYSIQPFNYQLENINWCKNIESIINTEESAIIINGFSEKTKIDQYIILNNDILYIYNKTIIHPEINSMIRYYANIQGGLLCDNTGLGKTLTLTVHITDDITTFNTIINERGSMLLSSKNKIMNKAFEDSVIKENILNIIDDQYKMLYYNYRLKTNCNLLIVPVRLLQQWESEIRKYRPSVNIYVINTVRDYYKLKLESINNYDIIIIPITFIQNEKRILHSENFDLCDILWKRVIVDEVHEIFSNDANSRRNNTMINKIKGLYKWGISATPSLNLECSKIISFLTNGIFMENDTVYFPKFRTCINVRDVWNFMNRYYRYNEVIKVNEEIHIPEFEESVIELEMSNIEKLLYNNATGDTKRMLALCTNYKISNHDSSIDGYSTVSDLKNRMLDQHNKKKKEHIEKIETQKKTNGHIKELLEWFYTDRKDVPEHIKINYMIVADDYTTSTLYTQDLNLINDVIERITKKLDTNEKHMLSLDKELRLIESKEKMIENFDSLIEENLNEPCMICFGNFESVMITTCNHMYCGKCVNEMFKNTSNIKCPMCRNPLTRSEVNGIVDKNLNLITGDDMKKKLETHEQENINMTNGGTKIDTIVKYIKEYDGKIIIFATEKKTLDLMNDILTENKIEFVNLKGNSYVISKQLKRFKTGTNKVILLSADRENSGTNLIEASCIILLDTHLVSDYKLRKDIEKQAIGRAVRLGQKKNVKVLRFIMKNTIEQVYLNKQD